MFLTYRNARTEDLIQVLPYFQNRLPHLQGHDVALRSLLAHLLSTGMAPAMVVEDRDRPAKKRVVAMSLSLFANRAFLSFVQDPKRSAGLALHAVEWWAQGKPVDVTAATFSEEQAEGGGDLVILVTGVNSADYQGPDFDRIREHLSQGTLKQVFTFRLRSFNDEVYGEHELARLKAFGMRLYHDFGADKKKLKAPKQPFLVGTLIAENREAPKRTGTITERYALLPEPRFGFTFREQEILRHALTGSTDNEIAKQLGLTLIGIKKRWEAIYTRVSAADPELFAEAKDQQQNLSRQNRRTLVQLLAEHPEEFWASKKGKRQG